MKKIALLLMVVICLTSLTVGNAENALPEFADLTDLNDFLSGIDEENPIVSVYFSHGYGFSVSEFSTADSARIDRVVSALKKLEITGVSEMDVTDWYPGLRMLAADGTTLSVSFNGEWLELDGKHYELSGIRGFYDEMDRLIKETMEDRHTIVLNGTPVDLLSITLNDFYDAGFEAEIHMDSGEAYLTHPDYSGGMVVGIKDENPSSPLKYVSMAFANDLPVVWCGGTPYSDMSYWKNELYGVMYTMQDLADDFYPSDRCWKYADFYFGSRTWIQFISKGDAPELWIFGE